MNDGWVPSWIRGRLGPLSEALLLPWPGVLDHFLNTSSGAGGRVVFCREELSHEKV